MQKVGIGTLGVIGGLLLALIVQDLLATAFLSNGTIPIALGIALGFLMPVFAVLGAFIAVRIHNRSAKRAAAKTTDE
jgi:uncharacterized protein YacL